MSSKQILILSFFFLLVGRLSAQNNTADAQYIKLLKEYQLNADGSVTYHYQHSLKYLTHFAFHTLYGETPITYNTTFQKVKVNYARTTMADGNVIESPANAYNEILPGFAANAPIYNNIRTLVVTHTGLEVGAVAEVDYTVTSGKGYFPALMGNECIKLLSPVDEYVYIVKIPAGQQLHYKLLNIDVKPEITTQGEFTQYKWVFTNLAGISQDKFKPFAATNEPYLIYSSAKDLQKVYTGFLNQPSMSFTADDKMIKWLQALKKESKTDLDFILKLQDKIAREIKTYPIPFSYTGYKTQSPKDVFYSLGGTVLEKAGLMATLLNNAGFKALPVFVAPTPLVDKEIGNLNIFEDVLVKVFVAPDQYMYFPVNQTIKQDMKFSLNDKTIIPINTETKIPEYITENTKDNKLSLSSNLTIDIQDKASALKGNFDCILTGCLNPYLKIYTDSTEVLKSLLTNAGPAKDDLKKIVKLNNFETWVDFDASLTGSAVLKEAGYYIITLPRYNDGFEHWQMGTMPPDRTAPAYLPHPLTEKYAFNIVLPKGFELANDAVDFVLENTAGKISYQLSKDKAGFRVVKELYLPSAYISADQYTQLKEIINNWKDIMNKQVIIKKI